MDDVGLSIVTNVIIAIAVGAVSAWITASISLRRFRKERWWERKALAYERIIEALYHSKAFSETYLEAEYRNRELDQEEENEVRSGAKNSHKEISRAISVGEFLLSDEAIRRLKEYRKESKASSAVNSWIEYLESDYEITNKVLDHMISIAKRDLKAH